MTWTRRNKDDIVKKIGKIDRRGRGTPRNKWMEIDIEWLAIGRDKDESYKVLSPLRGIKAKIRKKVCNKRSIG